MSGGIAAAGLALSAIGVATSVAGEMQQASAQSAAAKYQSEVAAGNQKIAEQNANYMAASGEAQAALQEQKTRAEVGSIAAAQASSGVDINSQTSSNVRTSKGELGALDAQTIRSNAARQAYGYEVQGAGFQNSASADIAQSNNAITAGGVGAGGSLLNGFGNEAMNYSSAMNKGSGIGAFFSSNSAGVTPSFETNSAGVTPSFR